MLDNYFELRNISQSTYDDYNLPLYLKNILIKKEARILDFGCGFGQLIIALRQSGFSNVEGADINAAAIESLNARQITVHNLALDTDFYNRNAEKYDFIVMSHVLEHIPKNEIIRLLILVRALLIPGGNLIVMVPNAQSNTGCYWAYEDFTHHLLFTAGSLHYILRSAGFSEVAFLDVDCLTESVGIKKILKKFLLLLYKSNHNFWNKVTSSHLHAPSPQIFSYEIKAIARK
jgi:2-polyprenyl-3-methyl-5-hydroxy-6-metoxy-1,4-benzoquinol methylase